MRRPIFGAWLLLCAACVAPPEDLALESAAGETPLVSASTPDFGETIYHAICWACHGHGGHGDGPAVAQLESSRPPTFHTQDYAAAEPERLERMFHRALRVEQTDQVHPHYEQVLPLLDLDYLPDVMSYIAALTAPESIPGSALSGAELYRQYCAICHGSEGRGDGPAREMFPDLEPSDLTTDAFVLAQDWDALHDNLHTGFSRVHRVNMPTWGEILDSGQLWDLVAYLSTL